MKIEKVDHVAIAVADIERAARLFVDVLGGQFVGGGDNPELKVRAVQIRFPPGMSVELLTPLTPDSYLQRYLDRTGEGFHHLTAYVPDVSATAVELENAGFATVDTDTSRESWHETFSRPASSFGALIQFARPEVPWTEPLEGVTLRDVLDGRVQVLANVTTWKDTGESILPRSSATA